MVHLSVDPHLWLCFVNMLDMESAHKCDEFFLFANDFKNKNMKGAKQMWKWIFIMLTYANIKITWQHYGARSCLTLVLNKLKEMKGLIFVYTPLGT